MEMTEPCEHAWVYRGPIMDCWLRYCKKCGRREWD
jgi:hypothetical protein